MLATAQSILKRDPAARTLSMVVLTYPGLHALGCYRVAHWFHVHHHYLLAAMITRWSAHRTAIYIDPGAKIGRNLFIDHGFGVVIGATAIIDDDVTILHGVTLGARHEVGHHRHPHIKSHAFVGAHAQLLGNITIGEYAKIGANAVVLNNIPDHFTAAGNPARIVQSKHISR